MKKKDKTINLERIADEWIDSIESIQQQSVSPFFKERVLNRIQESTQVAYSPSIIERYFYKGALASIIVLLAINVVLVINGARANTHSNTGIEYLVEEYHNLDSDTYENYSLLAFDTNESSYDENR